MASDGRNIMELISVIVPVYNVENYLRRCIDSLLIQTYSKLEIILVDDGSTDSSSIICDSYKAQDERVVVVHKTNGGLSSARNVGIDIANGKYIGFIDSDDWIAPETYEVLYRNLIQTDADVSDIDSIITSVEVKYQNKSEELKVLDGRDILIDYFISDKYSCCRKLYKRDIIGKVRFPVGKINEDIATNYQFLSMAKREVKSSLKLYYYFSNPNSITGRTFRKRDFDLLDACDLLIDLTKCDEELLELARIKQATSYYSLIGRYISYECENDFDPTDEIIILWNMLKEQHPLLMKSHISAKRKVLITLCVVFEPKFLRSVYRKMKGKA